MKLYLSFNIHVVSEDDWNYVLSRVSSVVDVLSFIPISSTELVIDVPEGTDLSRLCSLKFVDKVGTVIGEFSEDNLNDLLDFLKNLHCSLIVRVNDFRLRSLITRLRSLKESCNDFVIVRDYFEDSKVKVLIIKPMDFEMFCDVFDMWCRCFSDYRPIFVVSGLCSENEVLSCVRVASALRVRLYLVNPRIRFSCRKKLNEFKKFLSLSKCRIVKDFESIIERFRENYVIIGLSMHSHKGEIDLVRVLEEDCRDPVFLIGGELWGLSVREIEVCHHVVRLGPSSGVPMSASEVISYVTSIVRTIRRRPRC
ncbi:MAG: TrmH family RNA methyltransferase [Crenarchaeota archaeon]|nr:TrmH family RNA methyltransferase [Thermoproteota archaeon]